MNETATIEWTDKQGRHHFKQMSFTSCMKYMQHARSEGYQDITITLGSMKVVSP